MSVRDEYCGLLVLQVIEAKDLPKMDLLGKTDPYCVVQFGTDQKFTTKKLMKTLNPQWNQTFRILVKESQKRFELTFSIYDFDVASKDDLIGTAHFDISGLWQKEEEVWIPITDKKQKNCGSLRLKLTMMNKQRVEHDFWMNFASYFDADHTNTISLLELAALLEGINSSASDEEIKTLFDRADKDKSGQLSFDEFCALMSSDAQNLTKNPVLSAILPEGTMDFIWDMSAKADTENSSIGQLMLARGFYGKVESKREATDKDNIIVFDRKSGKLLEEKIPEYIKMSLRMMYSTASGRFAVDGLQLKKVLKHLTVQQAKKYDHPESAKEIPEFIKFHNLNEQEILEPLNNFKTFNEFFYRKLKPTARPIASPSTSRLAVSPADCRLHVFPTIEAATNLWIKGKNFNLKNLLCDDTLAKQYEGGSLVIARLAPQDYHRFHSPVDGTLQSLTPFDGAYYTVNPIAIRENVDVYTENKRVRGIIATKDFGDVLYIAVGATMVGSIFFTKKVGEKITKGDEMGYFAFGGSTVLVIFKKGAIKFDQDLLVNSAKPIETLVAVGNSLGVAPEEF